MISGDIDKMKKYWGDYYYHIPYTRAHKKLNRRFRKLKKTFKLKSAFTYTIDEWYDPMIDQHVSELLKKVRFDVVMVEYVFFSKVLCNFYKNVLKIIDTHDVFTDRHLLHIRKGIKPKWFSTTARDERKGLLRADVVIAIQDKEAIFFESLLNNSCKVISVGHITNLCPQDFEAINNNRILIIASNNAANLHATTQFMTNVYPKIKNIVPNVEVILVGTLCDSIEDYEGLVKIGKVDDLSGIYRTAAVVINPTTFGTGLKIKTIEALGYSKPLVTTPVGAEGLEDGDNIAFLIAHTKIEFAEKVINILTDPVLSKRLSLNANEFARKWNHRCMSQLERLLN